MDFPPARSNIMQSFPVSIFRQSPLRTALLLILCAAGPAQALGTPGAAVGPALRYNLTSPGGQQQVATASDADGDAVSVWYSAASAGQPAGIRARRLDSAGTPLGGEIAVNSLPLYGSYPYPEVAMDKDGNFTIVWAAPGAQPGSETRLYRRRFDRLGNALETQQLVDSNVAGSATDAAVALTATGAGVVTWKNWIGSTLEIRARRFDAAGATLGSEISVAVATGSDLGPDLHVAADDAGNFTVLWTEDKYNGANFDVYRRRFSAAGAALGLAMRINSATAGPQRRAALGMDAAGNSVIIWESLISSGNSRVLGQRYDASGNAVGASQFILAYQQPYPAYEAMHVAVAMARAGGEFSTAWRRRDNSIWLRRYAADGTALGGEVAVSASSANPQFPRIASDADGDLSVAWQDDESSWSGDYGVMGRRIAGYRSVDLSASLSGTIDAVAVPPLLDYSVTVSNLQPANSNSVGSASGIVAVFTPPADGVVLSAAGSDWHCDSGGAAPRCTYLPALAAGGVTPPLQIRVGGSTAANPQAAVQVAGSQYDAVTGNDAAVLTLP
jgi:hypothetical protein